jgi:hypothetical protein
MEERSTIRTVEIKRAVTDPRTGESRRMSFYGRTREEAEAKADEYERQQKESE